MVDCPWAPEVGWAAPPPGICKINVDGATAGCGGWSTVGVVIRDSRGMVVAAGCKVLNGDYGAAVTEAFAVDEGVRLAMELELQQIIVESDSVGVVEAINEGNCNGEFGMIIQGSLELLRSFRSWNVRYLKRDYNRAAHELAQFAKAAGSSQQWKGVEPPMLRHVLLLDRAKS
ncbi:putative ribonuclease h protein [Quercus suber]|uniref:Ribonuclease h protein n=1 Tax=Quercus suber TaxID=58331 RepID=A0AAW0K3Z8_QUESU